MPKLTKRTIDSLLPRNGAGADYFVWDDELRGFGVRVRSNGRKVFVLQYKTGAGVTRRVAIGEHGPFTVDQARATATKLRADVLAARRDPEASDPARARDLARRNERLSLTAPTVAEVADEFLKECEAKLKASTAAEYRRVLGAPSGKRVRKKNSRAGELRLALGSQKIAEVTRQEISKLHLRMADRPYQANRLLASLSALFTFAERHGHRPEHSNPCRGIPGFREQKRERYLNNEEFAALGDSLTRAESEGLPLPRSSRTASRRRASEKTAKHRTKDTGTDGSRKPKPASPVGVAVIRFLLLSGWREGEALTLKWEHLDESRKVASLPDTKTGQSVRALGGPAFDLLKAMRTHRVLGNPYVFPGSKPGSHFTDTARIWYAVRYAAGLPDVRLHDLRHAFASVAASGGLTLPLIGALLGHTDSATTARYAHLVETAQTSAAEVTSAAVAAALAGKPPAAQSEDGGESSGPRVAQVLPFARVR